MFIYNFKINGTKFFKIFFTIIIIFVICILGVVVYRIFNGASQSFFVSDTITEPKSSIIDAKNYTNILKCVHEDVNSYIGKKISFTGYVYKVSDLAENQFILARNMIISSDYQYLVVGFLCESDKIKDFKDNSWIEVTGELYKGSYHGADIPIIKLTNIHNTSKPNDEFVYPPDETYIPTDAMLLN